MSNAAATPGARFATKDSPYIQYLRSISQDWWEADQFRQDLELCVEQAASQRHSQDNDRQIAQVIDVYATPYQAHQHPPLRLKDLNNATVDQAGARAVQIDRFLSGATQRPEGLHTRIILLSADVQRDTDRLAVSQDATIKLLYAHLLGVGLALEPLEVALLSNIGTQTKAARWRSQMRLRPLQINQAYFGSDAAGRAGCIVHWIGHRYSNRRADTVICSVHPSWLPVAGGDRPIWPSSAYGMFDIARARSRQDPLPSAYRPDAMSILAQAIVRSARNDVLSEARQKSTYWLAAVLQVEYSALRYELDCVDMAMDNATRQRSPEASLRFANQFSVLKEAVQTCLSSSEALIDEVPLRCKDQRTTALHKITAQLKRLHTLVRDRAQILEAAANIEVKLQELKMTEMSIDESRSAVALTFLAFIFVPMSLATSVFGMNVQEINQTGLSIWWSVGVAIFLVVAAVLVLVIWRRSSRTMKRIDAGRNLSNKLLLKQMGTEAAQKIHSTQQQGFQGTKHNVYGIVDLCRHKLGHERSNAVIV